MLPTRLLGMLGIFAPALFVTLIVVASTQYDGYSHTSQKISELGSVTATQPSIQNVNFMLLAILTLGFAVGVDRAIAPGGRAIGPMLIGAFGVLAAGFNAVLPCDAGCEAITTPGTLHLATGLGGFLCFIAGLVFMSRRIASAGGPKWYSRYTLASAISPFVTTILFRIIDSGPEPTLGGLEQRFFVAPFLLWMAVPGVRIATAAYDATREVRTAPAVQPV